ncbi:hypothetical protein ACJ72_08114 [Emergomyces africanus]|uniref:Minor histocompatibility antigen H13 n=1 Tax=Emergomyces africanus TaxID=1955775 RepID=A0A1B7NLT2_9EURO|nr:hypothetical protein ACJ72_08114 [Emergomyces africanus]
MQFMSPTTFWTGSLVLSALFFYDIYFVFFTPLMVTVAKSLDIPIKLVFPRPAAPGEDPDLVSMAMLGLGDIVIPGMVIGLALRFDLFLYYKAKAVLLNKPEKIPYVNAVGRWGERFWTTWFTSASSHAPLTFPRRQEGKLTFHEARSFPKTYFHAGLIGYVTGMLATLLAMQISNHAQPALLYLVPGVLGSLWMTALVKGDIKEMWNFSDAIEEEEDQEAEKDKIGEKEKEEKEKEIFPSPYGLFRKIFLGEDSKASTLSPSSASPVSSKESPKSTEDTNKKDEAKTKKPTANETCTTLDLISFSISLPKPNPRTGTDTTTDADDQKADKDTKTPPSNPTKEAEETVEGNNDEEDEFDASDSQSEPSSSSSSSPVLVVAATGAAGEEPAMKKRRTRRAV